MDTSKMKLFEAFSNARNFLVLKEVEDLRSLAGNILESMEMALIRNQIIEALQDYDLGIVTDVYEIFGGYINRSFGVYTEKDGKQYEYFVRKYKKGITDKEIRFEHSLIDFSVANGLTIAASLVPNRAGQTFVKKTEGLNGEQSDNYFAVYEYLSGEDKYTWDNPTMNDEEYASAAEVLAVFHNASRHFDPQGLERIEPKILEFLPTLSALYREFAAIEPTTKFHRYYLQNLAEILEVIERTQIPAEAVAKMPYNPCHNDLHPGNLKFLDNKAVGVFDFDWSKVELRLFDVSLSLAYCCSSWSDLEDGTLKLDKCAIFLNSYQKKLEELGGLAPLNETEIEYLPIMIAAANLYLVNWDVTAYYNGTDLNDYEYLAYLQHNVRLMKWIEAHKSEIAEMAKSIK